MIRTNREYNITQQLLKENRSALDETRMYLRAEGFSPDETEELLESLYAVQRQLLDDVAEYDRARAGQLEPCTFQTLERLLIGGRIARGLTQEQFAALLGYSDSSTVSRDESSDYRGAKRERIQRALDALGIDAVMVPRFKEAPRDVGWQDLVIGHMNQVPPQATPVTVTTATAMVQPAAAATAQSSFAQVDVSRQAVVQQTIQSESMFQGPESNYVGGYTVPSGVGVQVPVTKDVVIAGSGAWAA